MPSDLKATMNGSVPADVRAFPAQRLRGLDALRGLAALSVMLYHYTTGYESHFGRYTSQPFFYLPNGHFGVELFFCISGFVILGTLERSGDVMRFFVARLARIYPAYLLCATLSLMTVRLAHFNFPGLTAKTVALNATMLTGLMGVQAIDPSYWTLSYELLFYAGSAIVWSLLSRERRLELPCLAWLCCSLGGRLLDLDHRNHGLAVFLNVEYANLFVLGMMLYYHHRGSRTRLTNVTICAALILTLFPPEFNAGHMPQPVYVAMILAACGAICLVSQSGGKFLDVQPLVFLGEVSYSLYLIHQMVGFAVIRALLRAGIGTNVAILITILLMIGVAFCLRILVEKPAERRIRSLFKRGVKEPETHQSHCAYWLLGTRPE